MVVRTLALTLGVLVIGCPAWGLWSRTEEDAIELGGRTFAVGEAIAMPAPRMLPESLDGVMGREFLTNGTLVMDFVNDRLIYDEDRPLADAESEAFTWEEGHITVPLHYGGEIMDAHFDSGNTASPFGFPAEVAEAVGLGNLEGEAHEASTATGRYTIRIVELPEPVVVGGQRFEGARVLYPVPAPVANIGAPAVAGHVVVVDFVDRRFGIFSPGDPVLTAFRSVAPPTEASGEAGLFVFGNSSRDPDQDLGPHLSFQ